MNTCNGVITVCFFNLYFRNNIDIERFELKLISSAQGLYHHLFDIISPLYRPIGTSGKYCTLTFEKRSAIRRALCLMHEATTYVETAHLKRYFITLSLVLEREMSTFSECYLYNVLNNNK